MLQLIKKRVEDIRVGDRIILPAEGLMNPMRVTIMDHLGFNVVRVEIHPNDLTDETSLMLVYKFEHDEYETWGSEEVNTYLQ